MVLVVRVYADALYVRFICHALLLRAGVAAAPSTAAQNHPVRERDAAREPHRRHAGNTSEKAHILKSLFDSGVIYRKCTRALTFQNALETPLNFKSPQRAVEKTLRCYGGDCSRLLDVCREVLCVCVCVSMHVHGAGGAPTQAQV